MKPLCQTCINIFHFPECCTENLTDCVRLITNCGNYSKHDMGENDNAEMEVAHNATKTISKGFGI